MLDMAGSMNMIAQQCFPRTVRVTDRFRAKISYRSPTRNPYQTLGKMKSLSRQKFLRPYICQKYW